MRFFAMIKFGCLAGILALAVFACSGSEVAGVCNDNGDCDTGFYCGPDHQCLCQADTSCAADEFCNANGFCQKYQGCRLDADCGDAANFRCQIEQTGKGTCLCRNDGACKSEEYCNASGVCQKKAGCILDSDCGDDTLWFCRINSDTKIGECFCKADGACEQGEFCNPHGYCQPLSTCTSNDDCQAGKLCDIPSGECLCDSDAQTGCASGEVCNSSGYCQPRPGCYDNSDCTDIAGTFCDITTRTCIPNGTCTTDRQCPIGQVCQNGACADGCHYASDCELTECCVSNQCQTCDCQNDDFCAFAEFCNNSNCQSGYSQDTPYCKPCNSQSTDYTQCGDVLNRCLIYPFTNDTFAGHSDEYCAMDCSTNDRCPKGFGCSEIVVIKSTDECVTDNDCPSGVPCWKGPEEDKGYCPCHPQKNSCPLDSCDVFGIVGPPNTCINKRTPCSSSLDCTIECVSDQADGFGGCVIGKTCGLQEGIHCPYPFP